MLANNQPFIRVCLLIIFNSRPSPDLHCCLGYEKVPFKVHLINVLRLKVIQEKNRFDFGFGWGYFSPWKNYLLLMLEVINVYEVVVFMYVL